MIITILKHYIYDIALKSMFDNICMNFNAHKKISVDVNSLNVGDFVYITSNSEESANDCYSGIIKYIDNGRITLKLSPDDVQRVHFNEVAFLAAYYNWYK